jgi:DNA-binding ferritin-like protein
MTPQTQRKRAQSKSETAYEEAAERIRSLNERIIEAARKAGGTYLDAYEKSLRSIAEYEEKVAETTPVEWLGALLNAQADFVREVAKAATASAREVLK